MEGQTYFLLQQALDKRSFALPNLGKLGSGLQRVYPDCDTKTQCKGGAYNDQPALHAQPASVCRKEKPRQGQEKGNEDEDGIYHTRCTMISSRTRSTVVGLCHIETTSDDVPHERKGPQWEPEYRLKWADPTRGPPQLRHVLSVPVSGHWSSRRF